MPPDARDAGVLLSAAAHDEWARNVEEVLLGVAHALNNRAAALSAVMELSTEPPEDPAVIRSILESELDRVQGLSRVMRAMGAPRSGEEAFAPGDAVAEVLAVMAHHARHRDRAVAIDASGATPIRVPRWMFVRSLIALAATVAQSGAETPNDESLRGIVIREEGDWLVTHAAGAPGRLPPSVLMTELARAMGGEPLTASEDGSGRVGFRVPTLREVRRREGR